MPPSPTSSTGPEGDHRQRVFVAVWPPDPAVAQLTRVVDRVRPAADGAVRWQPPERWHITLVFVPRAGADFLARIIAAVDRVARRHPPAPVALEAAGLFPRVLWLAARGAWLTSVHTTLCRELRLQPEHRFRPHLTLARSRGPTVSGEVVAELRTALAAQPPVSWRADHLRVVASVTGPQPRYTILHRAPLTG